MYCQTIYLSINVKIALLLNFSVNHALLKPIYATHFTMSKWVPCKPIHITILTYIQHWNGKSFECVTLTDLGLQIQLGHSVGEICLLPTPAASDNAFIVIDSHGVHEVSLDFCRCGIHGTKVQQLLWWQLYPTTVSNPITATMFCILHHFQLLSFESKCLAYQYFQTLVCKSDNTGLYLTKVYEWCNCFSLE